MVVTTAHRYQAVTQGHVAVYARDARWRRAVAASLEEAGHSCGEAANVEEMKRLLTGQRFDVLALKVRNEAEADDVAEALAGVKLPLHTIVLGSASVLPASLPRRRGGTFRYVPGPLPARELSRLVDVSISAGMWEEGASDNSEIANLEQVELEETIDSAAAAVYSQANRKHQRFHSAVVGPATHAFADPAKLRQALIALLRMTVSAAPYRALISVDAETSRGEWLIRISATNGKRAPRRRAETTEALRGEAKTLAAVARALQEQGGMLWVELAGPAALAFSLTLPFSPEAAQIVSA